MLHYAQIDSTPFNASDSSLKSHCRPIQYRYTVVPTSSVSFYPTSSLNLYPNSTTRRDGLEPTDGKTLITDHSGAVARWWRSLVGKNVENTAHLRTVGPQKLFWEGAVLLHGGDTQQSRIIQLSLELKSSCLPLTTRMNLHSDPPSWRSEQRKSIDENNAVIQEGYVDQIYRFLRRAEMRSTLVTNILRWTSSCRQQQ